MSEQTIRTAQFNPRIKQYLLWVGAFFILISIIGIPVLLVWFLGLGQHMGRRYYESLECRLTDKHLEFKKGFLFRVEKTIPLENIQDLTFIDNPFLRLFELRVLKIETAGQSNPQGTDMKLIGIIDALEFKKLVLDQRSALTQEVPDGPAASTGQTEVLEEIRDLLKQIKDQMGS